MTDPIYGDWGKNGKYGRQASVQIAYHDVARAILAESQSTISGYSGLIPATVKSGQIISNKIAIDGALTVLANPLNAKVVCMLLDANTGRVINADVCNLTDANAESIDELSTENSAQVVAIYSANGTQLKELQKSLNILLMQEPDGRTFIRKVMIR